MVALARHLLFTNVNEDGVPYGTHRNLEEAADMLWEFPNDTIVVTVKEFDEVEELD